MAKLLLNLRNVGDDEYADVCTLLDQHGIARYRTEPSPWGISNGGLWLREDADHPRAKALMAEYQAERGPRIRAEREQALRDGTAETFGSLFRRRPLFVMLVLLGMAAAAALVLLPFVLLRGKGFRPGCTRHPQTQRRRQKPGFSGRVGRCGEAGTANAAPACLVERHPWRSAPCPHRPTPDRFRVSAGLGVGSSAAQGTDP